MAIHGPLATTLHAAATLMRGAHDPWWIIGSAAVALHGAEAGPVADVDILAGTDDAARILSSLGIEPGRGSDHPAFRSDIFGIWRSAPLPVEIMAGFRHRSGGGWVPVRPASRQPIDVDGTLVFIPDRAELKRLLAAFGRPKDLERARRLAAPEGGRPDR